MDIKKIQEQNDTVQWFYQAQTDFMIFMFVIVVIIAFLVGVI